MIYATFLMRNDSFVPGALVFAHALKKQGIKNRYVFITDDISKHAKHYLDQAFDRTIVIDKKRIPHSNTKGRQDRADLFTRFEVLKFHDSIDPLGSKILLADSDVLPLRHYADLTKMKSPSAIINEKESYTTAIVDHQYIVDEAVIRHGTWHWHKRYEAYLKGEKIPKAITDQVLVDPLNLGMNTALWIFNTQWAAYDAIQLDLADEKTLERINQYRWPEMQYITGKWSGDWHTIDIKYASFSGYPRIDLVNGIHYAGLKPWATNHRSFKHYAQFKDFRLWHYIFLQMTDEMPELLDYPKLNRLRSVSADIFTENPYTEEELSHAPDWV